MCLSLSESLFDKFTEISRIYDTQCGCATVGKLSTTECGVASVRAGLGTLASVPPLTGMNESHHSPGGDQEETETP